MRAKAQNNLKSVLAYFGVPENKKPRFPKRELENKKRRNLLRLRRFLAPWKGFGPPTCRLGAEQSLKKCRKDKAFSGLQYPLYPNCTQNQISAPDQIGLVYLFLDDFANTMSGARNVKNQTSYHSRIFLSFF